MIFFAILTKTICPGVFVDFDKNSCSGCNFANPTTTEGLISVQNYCFLGENANVCNFLELFFEKNLVLSGTFCNFAASIKKDLLMWVLMNYEMHTGVDEEIRRAESREVLLEDYHRLRSTGYNLPWIKYV